MKFRLVVLIIVWINVLPLFADNTGPVINKNMLKRPNVPGNTSSDKYEIQPSSLLSGNGFDRFVQLQHKLPMGVQSVNRYSRPGLDLLHTGYQVPDSIISYIGDDKYKICLTFNNDGQVLTWANYYWKEETGTWQLNEKDVYTYDSQGNVLTELNESWDVTTGQYDSGLMSEWTYNESSDSVFVLIQQLQAGAEHWENMLLSTITMDENGNKATLLNQAWDPEINDWTNYYRAKKIFDSNDMLSSFTIEIWNPNRNDWMFYNRDIYTLDDRGNLLVLRNENWNASSETWIYNYRETSTYDDNNNQLTYLGELWNQGDNDWFKVVRETNMYDNNNNLLIHYSDLWDDTVLEWTHNDCDSNIFDSNNNLLTHVAKSWDQNANGWDFVYRDSYVYDDAGNFIHYNCNYWAGDDWSIGNGGSINECTFILFTYDVFFVGYHQLDAYYSHSNTLVENDNVKGVDGFRLSQNYPNPFNPSTIISYYVPTDTHVKLQVFNALGKEVTRLADQAHKAGGYSKIFDASGLASGVYFYKISTGNTSVMKKMLLLQ